MFFSKAEKKKFCDTGFLFHKSQNNDSQYLEELERHFHRLKRDDFTDIHDGNRNRSLSIANIENNNITWTDPELFYQSAQDNSKYGGIKRKFPPLDDRLKESEALKGLLLNSMSVCLSRFDLKEKIIGVHAIRTIYTEGRQGNPTPEGAHRDGFTCISIHLCKRENVDRCNNQIYAEDEAPPEEIELTAPGDTIFLDDQKYKHAVTAFGSSNPGRPCFRDVFVFTYGAPLPKK